MPIMIPSAIPTIAESEKPMATRPKLARICKPSPLSVPPLSKKGLMIRGFQVSCKVFNGPGKLPSGFQQSTCQIISRTASASSGGRMFLVKKVPNLFELLLLERLSSVVVIKRGKGKNRRKGKGKEAILSISSLPINLG